MSQCDCEHCKEMRAKEPTRCLIAGASDPLQPCTFERDHSGACSFTLGTGREPTSATTTHLRMSDLPTVLAGNDATLERIRIVNWLRDEAPYNDASAVLEVLADQIDAGDHWVDAEEALERGADRLAKLCASDAQAPTDATNMVRDMRCPYCGQMRTDSASRTGEKP